ncbi:MAG: 4Fe-4S dicluster domain-containing protein [Desulfobacterales bacterium]
MKWTLEAENAIGKVPFFVRKKVRERVEREASLEGKEVVTLEEVTATQKRYLAGMESEMRGYQLDVCFGPGGCPNRAVRADRLVDRIRELLEGEDLMGFLKNTVPGKLRFHHEFRVGVADCPNACSQVQIKDVGILGACVPRVTAEACTACGACESACRDDAISLNPDRPGPELNDVRCTKCGKCVEVCPSGTLAEGQRGYRVQLGGKLGRHPRLAVELPGIHTEEDVLRVLRECIGLYKRRSRNGRRFAELLETADLEAFAKNGSFPD